MCRISVSVNLFYIVLSGGGWGLGLWVPPIPRLKVLESVTKIVFGPPTPQCKLSLFFVPHKFDGMKPFYCAILFSILYKVYFQHLYIHTRTHTNTRGHTHTHTHTHSCMCVKWGPIYFLSPKWGRVCRVFNTRKLVFNPLTGDQIVHNTHNTWF